MSSLKVDNITGRGSTGFTGSVKSEGGNTTTDLQQGLAKTWLRMDGDTIAINDSLNITSITDQAVGNYRVAIANDMANANYAATTGAGGAVRIIH